MLGPFPGGDYSTVAGDLTVDDFETQIEARLDDRNTPTQRELVPEAGD
jgi:hypothetical protein